MISKRDVKKKIHPHIIKQYHEDMETYQRKMDETRKPNDFDHTGWGWYDGEDYVSLPFLWKTLRLDKKSSLFRNLNKSPFIWVHPGFTLSTEVYDYMLFHPEKYGDYESEYLEPIKKEINIAKKQERPIYIYIPQNRRNESLNFIEKYDIANREEVILIPTIAGRWQINKYILGVDNEEFHSFLKYLDIKEVEIHGEMYGVCYDNVIDDFLRAGFKVKYGKKFPLANPIKV